MRSATRQVRLFRNGRNQALRIPREFELEGDRARVDREGERLIVQPLIGKIVLECSRALGT
jgi:antitoxin VapB